MSIKWIWVFTISIIGLLYINNQPLIYPDHFPPPTYNFSKNALTQSKIDLGRALFYDPTLSKDNTISCASCHSPYNAFAHTDHDLSHGIDDSIGTRNAPALFNLAWSKSFMWDGAINHLDMQALAPIEHPGEMAESFDNVINKLRSSNIYPSLFMQAFQDSTITGEKTLKALSAFQLTLVSASSKYDKVKMGIDSFTKQENNGYILFKNNCSHCHSEPLFTNGGFENNGIPIDTTLNDVGRSNVTKQESDRQKFKVPSLRNLKYTYPYMHDGRFKSLSEIIKHYVDVGPQNLNITDTLKNKIELSSNEKVDLISFLLTLSDPEFVFDKKHQYPRDLLLGEY